MKLQISTDYAVRILQCLHSRNGKSIPATEIAESIGITYPFFIKIANQLRKRGLLRSVQGRNGGYLLGKPACEISLYEVFLCIEGELQFSRCLTKGAPCQQGEMRNCKLRVFLYDLQGKVIEEMSERSIADLSS